MKTNNQPNAEILAVLEAHGLNWQTFAVLRSDSYEQQLARSSPEELDKFYALLFSPGIALEMKAVQCPVWPPGTKFDGSHPTKRILSEVVTRWNSERALNVVDQVGAMMDKFRAKISKVPGAETANVTDSLFAMLSQELLATKLEGEDLTFKTKALDRLLRKQAMDFNREKFKEGLRTKLESGLAELSQHIKSNPQAQAAYEALEKSIADATK